MIYLSPHNLNIKIAAILQSRVFFKSIDCNNLRNVGKTGLVRSLGWFLRTTKKRKLTVVFDITL